MELLKLWMGYGHTCEFQNAVAGDACSMGVGSLQTHFRYQCLGCLSSSINLPVSYSVCVASPEIVIEILL